MICCICTCSLHKTQILSEISMLEHRLWESHGEVNACLTNCSVICDSDDSEVTFLEVRTSLYNEILCACKHRGFLGGWLGKESACNAGDHLQCRRLGFDPWVRKIPWIRKWKVTTVFLAGKSRGQRSLVGYSPKGLKESNMNEWVNTRY